MARVAQPSSGRSTSAAPVSRRRGWSAVLLLIALVLIGHLIWSLGNQGLPPQTWALLLWVVPIQLCCQILRALRLFLLSYDRRMHVGDLFGVHLVSVSLSHMIPFKLGELVRIALLGRLLRDPTRALLAIWSERIYDVSMVTILIVTFGALIADAPLARAPFLILAIVFLFGSFFLFLVLPENLSMFKRYLLFRTESRSSLGLLRLVDGLHGVLQQAGAMWRAHWATVSWLTIAIWGLECCWIATVAHLLVEDGATGPALLQLFEAATLAATIWELDGEGLSRALHLALQLVMIDALAVVGIIAAAFMLRRGNLEQPTSINGVAP